MNLYMNILFIFFDLWNESGRIADNFSMEICSRNPGIMSVIMKWGKHVSTPFIDVLCTKIKKYIKKNS